MAVEVAGPFGGHFFCKVPPDTTVGLASNEDLLLDHTLGKESKEFRSSEEGSYVFIKTKGV